MTKVSDKICRENQQIIFSFKLFSENPAVYETRWKNIVGPYRSQMT
jgi:hypothetical protein